MGSMSASDAAPLPRLGEVYFDVRGESRSMRLSWYADTGVAVFSIWQGGTCTGTFRLPIADLPRMVEALQRGPRGDGRGGAARGGAAGGGEYRRTGAHGRYDEEEPRQGYGNGSLPGGYRSEPDGGYPAPGGYEDEPTGGYRGDAQRHGYQDEPARHGEADYADNPLTGRYPGENPHPARHPGEDPLTGRHPEQDPHPARYPEEDPLTGRYPEQGPHPARYPEEDPRPPRYQDDPLTGPYHEDPHPSRYQDDPLTGDYPDGPHTGDYPTGPAEGYPESASGYPDDAARRDYPASPGNAGYSPARPYVAPVPGGTGPAAEGRGRGHRRAPDREESDPSGDSFPYGRPPAEPEPRRRGR
jgi:hypothetical protein